MWLLPNEVLRELPIIGATENVRLEDKIVICKFFCPNTDLCWYVFEGGLEDNSDERKPEIDFIFFGKVHGVEQATFFYLKDLLYMHHVRSWIIQRNISVLKVSYKNIKHY